MVSILFYMCWSVIVFIGMISMGFILVFLTFCLISPMYMIDLLKLWWFLRVHPKIEKKGLYVWLYDCLFMVLVVILFLSICYYMYIVLLF